MQTLRRLLTRIPGADWFNLLLLTLAVLVFFSPVLFGDYFLPFGGGDMASLLWPNFRFAARSLHAGQLPLWNPHQFSGMPFWADNQTALLYPPNWPLWLLLPRIPYTGLELLVMAHIGLTGLLMYACLRLILSGESAIGPAPALLGALIWMFSDVFLTHLGNLNLNAAAAWLPLAFLGAWRGLRDVDLRCILAGAAAIALSILAGHAQMSYYILLLVAAVIGVQLSAFSIQQIRKQKAAGSRPLLLRLALAALLLALGAGLSAGAWLPTLELAAFTARAGLNYEQVSAFSIPTEALIGLVAPWVHGRGPFDFTGDWARVEVGYVGVAGLLLALIGLARSGWRRQGLGLFWGGLAILSFLLALGPATPLHRMAFDSLPGFDAIRAPARMVLLMNFGMAGLAALALQRRGTVPASGEEVSASPVSGRWVRGAHYVLAALVFAELTFFGFRTEIDQRDPTLGFRQPDLLAWFDSQPGAAQGAPYRVEITPGTVQPHLPTWSGAISDGYGFSQPLSLISYDSYWWSMGYRGSPMYNFLGVKYVIAGQEPPGDGRFVRAAEASGQVVWLNTTALPLAQVIYEAVSVEEMGAAWDQLHSEDWDPSRTVYVAAGPALAPSDLSSNQPAALSYQDYRANQITLRVTTSAPAYLVLAEPYYPGWRAWIDGQPAPIYEANLGFRAVFLPEAGDHEVALKFRPPRVYLGLAISVLSLLALIAVLLRSAQ